MFLLGLFFFCFLFGCYDSFLETSFAMLLLSLFVLEGSCCFVLNVPRIGSLQKVIVIDVEGILAGVEEKK